MDNIQDAINKIMSDPEALNQVQSLGKMLGLNNNTKPAEISVMPDNNSDIMGKLVSLAPLISQLQQEDDTTRLLTALRPFLSDEKCEKLDKAKKLLQIMKLMPMLKNTGLLDLGLF